MPTVRKPDVDFEQGSAIAQSAATHGSFASIFASLYFPQAYSEDGGVKSDVTTLPEVLAEHGYATAGFAAANPFVSKWQSRYDTFWNSGFEHDDDFINTDSLIHRLSETGDRLYDYLTLTDRITFREVRDEAANWYDSASSPRFLWVHFMDLHEPYLPGLTNGRDIGLLSVYWALLRFQYDREALSDQERSTIRSLYYACARVVDRQFESLMEFLSDDSLVIITGDHGEEFDHGTIRHARLYDEVVKVPLLTNWDRPLKNPVRHLDIAPQILSELGIPIPEQWMGEPLGSTERSTLLMNHTRQMNELYVGVRTPKYKYIKTFELDTWELLREELYDLESDPDEWNSIHREHPDVSGEFDEQISTFLDRDDVDKTVLNEWAIDSDSARVEQRLADLGYL